VPDGSPPNDCVGSARVKFRPKGQFVNQYTGITECYDLLMRGGYYDHDTMARAADAVIGDRKKVLELGVGTGLFAQSLAATKPDCDITGVDSRRPCWNSPKTAWEPTRG
jgi:ubiquinone/menaquinone biosynthesis C-methylase UbiE